MAEYESDDGDIFSVIKSNGVSDCLVHRAGFVAQTELSSEWPQPQAHSCHSRRDDGFRHRITHKSKFIE